MPKENIKDNEGLKITDIGVDFKHKFKKTTSDLPEKYIVLAVIKTKNYDKLSTSVLDLFVNDEKLAGIYLTTNKTYTKIRFAMNGQGKKIDAKKVFFIDCVEENIPEEDKENVFAAPPQNLTDLNIIIDSLLKKNKDISFIIVDSLSTFFIYNNPKEIEKFIRSVIKKLNDYKVKGVFITNQTHSNEAVIEELSLFFDKTIEMDI